MFHKSSGGGIEVGDAAILGSRLLLVDDDPSLLLALSGTLQNRLGHCTVDACESGMLALELVKAHTYDMIISDVRMPGMNGWQFLRAVKQMRSGTPVFLMSGSADHAVMNQALEAGASGFFAKPFDRNEFVRTVRDGLELSRLTGTSKGRVNDPPFQLSSCDTCREALSARCSVCDACEQHLCTATTVGSRMATKD